MAAFQRNLAEEFHQCRKQNKPFTLGMISLAVFAEYKGVFGPEAADDRVSVLLETVPEHDVVSHAMKFTTGAVMIPLPCVQSSEVDALVAVFEDRMQARGFVGEMLLSGKDIRLKGFAASYPDAGDDLASLTEQVLLGYSTLSV